MRKNRSKSQSYNNIFIIGMPAHHKSTFCRIYSYFSGRNFLDFEDVFEKSLRTPISKVFQSQGLQGVHPLFANCANIEHVTHKLKMLNEKAESSNENIKAWNNKGGFYGKKIKPTKKITISE